MVESKSFLSKKQMDQLSHYQEEPTPRDVQERRDKAFSMFKSSEQQWEKSQQDASKSSSSSNNNNSLLSQIGETLNNVADSIRTTFSGNNNNKK